MRIEVPNIEAEIQGSTIIGHVVESIDVSAVKKEIKSASKSIRDYISALERQIERKDDLIKQALSKIKQLSNE